MKGDALLAAKPSKLCRCDTHQHGVWDPATSRIVRGPPNVMELASAIGHDSLPMLSQVRASLPAP